MRLAAVSTLVPAAKPITKRLTALAEVTDGEPLVMLDPEPPEPPIMPDP
jgi:hypothetical protein